MTKIVTVAAAKGGVGKTTIAYELAYLLDAPLVDLDWDRGGATGSAWGYRVRDRVGAPSSMRLRRGEHPACYGASVSRTLCLRTRTWKLTSRRLAMSPMPLRSGQPSGLVPLLSSIPTLVRGM